MLCIDWNDAEQPIKIKGEEEFDNYQRLEAVLVPCNYVHSAFGYDDSINQECVPSLEE